MELDRLPRLREIKVSRSNTGRGEIAPFWTHTKEEILIEEKDDLLHLPTSNDPTWIETNFFSFTIPEHRIHGLLFAGFRTNLKLVGSLVAVWQGSKKQPLEADHYDLRSYIPFPDGDLNDYRLANGLSVKILDPMMRYQVDYTDAKRGTEIHLVFEAIMPPVSYPGGAHFDQAGKVDGTLVLAGKEYRIDCFAPRDHSWGPRPETPAIAPPVSWLHGIFDRDFAFHLMATDDFSSKPFWAGAYPVPEGKNIVGGYIFKNGVVTQVTTARKRTLRTAGTLIPSGYVLELIDDRNSSYVFRGEVTALLPIFVSGNTMVMEAQTRWSYGDRIGWGESQDVFFNDFVNRFSSCAAENGA